MEQENGTEKNLIQQENFKISFTYSMILRKNCIRMIIFKALWIFYLKFLQEKIILRNTIKILRIYVKSRDREIMYKISILPLTEGWTYIK